MQLFIQMKVLVYLWDKKYKGLMMDLYSFSFQLLSNPYQKKDINGKKRMQIIIESCIKRIGK